MEKMILQKFGFLNIEFGSKKLLKFLIITLCSITLCACSQRPTNLSPEEEAAYREAELQRANQMLSETSPRNQNQLPKAMPEFNAEVPGIGCARP